MANICSVGLHLEFPTKKDTKAFRLAFQHKLDAAEARNEGLKIADSKWLFDGCINDDGVKGLAVHGSTGTLCLNGGSWRNRSEERFLKILFLRMNWNSLIKGGEYGFYKLLTADNQESIRNIYAGECRTVYLLQPDGKPSIKEEAYEGYGVFGSVDAFVWLAMHNLSAEHLRQFENDIERVRDHGCAMENVDCAIPLKFSFDKDAVYEKLPASEYDPSQGFF